MPYLQEPELGNAVRYARSDHTIPIPRPARDSASGMVSACRTCHTDRAESALDAQVRQWYGELKPLPRAVVAVERATDPEDPAAAARTLLVPDERHTAALFAGMSLFLERYLRPGMPAFPREVTSRLDALARHEDVDVQAMALAALHLSRGDDPGVRRTLASALGGAGQREPLLRSRWGVVIGFMADRLRAAGNPLAAVEAYRKAREVDPANPRILVNMALAHADAGNLTAAVQAYRQSLSLDPVQPLTLVNLGIALAGQQDVAGAERAYRQALALNPREPLAYFNLAGLFARRGSLDSALANFERAVGADPSVALARFYAARIHIERQDYRAALREIEAGLAVDPGSAEAVAMRDQLRRQLGR
jgi:tetratricopeptide (TPR) repeat protein